MRLTPFPFFFFFNDTATTEIYTLSLHDALPISLDRPQGALERIGIRQRILSLWQLRNVVPGGPDRGTTFRRDRKSTRLNSSHDQISYAVFCLKKKKKNTHSDKAMSLDDVTMIFT